MTDPNPVRRLQLRNLSRGQLQTLCATLERELTALRHDLSNTRSQHDALFRILAAATEEAAIASRGKRWGMEWFRRRSRTFSVDRNLVFKPVAGRELVFTTVGSRIVVTFKDHAAALAVETPDASPEH